jgi:6-pyruvoyltetrahydropterin/6-carboxytetrahydropterin synthase
MFTLGVSDHIMIAHSFADPFFGSAQRMHGATYAVDLEVRAPALGEHHVVMDIGALRAILRAVLDALDMRNLDEHEAFPGRTSTTERIAEWIAGRAAEAMASLPAGAAPVGRMPEGSGRNETVSRASVRVVVRESPAAYAAYERPV